MEKSYKYFEASRALHIFIIVVLAAIAYSDSLFNSFHFDDRYVILEDPFIRNIKNLPVILSDIFNRPLLRATFAINYYFSGLSVFGYHVANLVFHILTSILVYFLAAVLSREFSRQYDKYRLFPLLSSLFFALHPLHTGTVTYIASRSAGLAALFFLSAFLFFLKALSSDGYKKYLFHSLASIILILSLGVKEIVVVFPLVAALYAFIIHPEGLLSYIKKYGIVISSYLLIIAGYILLRYLMLPDVAALDTRIEEGILPRYSYLLTELKVVIFYYLRWLLFPFDGPHVDPDIPPETTISDISTILAILVIAGLVTLSVFKRRKWPVISFGILWYFITLLPTSSILPIGDVAVERHVYMPSIGISIIAGYLLLKLRENLPMKTALTFYAVFFISFTYLTIEVNSIWKNELTLWEDAAKKAPDKIRALNNRAWGYYLSGDLDSSERYYKELLERHPEYPFGHINLGAVYQAKGDMAGAIREYEKGAALRPGHPAFRMSLGIAYDAVGLFDRALKELQIAAKLDPKNPQVLIALASTLAKAGDFNKSIEVVSEAIEIEPDNSMAHYILGYSYEMRGQFSEALNEYALALRLNPGWELPQKRISDLKARL